MTSAEIVVLPPVSAPISKSSSPTLTPDGRLLPKIVCAKTTLVSVNVFVTVLRPLINDVVVVGLDPKSKKT